MANYLHHCPRCGGRLWAGLSQNVSRTNNKTRICGACARVERAFTLAGRPLPQQDAWPICPAVED